MQPMPRPRPPHLHRTVTRHKKIAWYVHVPGRKRVRIRQRESFMRGELGLGLDDGKGWTPEQIAARKPEAAVVLMREVLRLREELAKLKEPTP